MRRNEIQRAKNARVDIAHRAPRATVGSCHTHPLVCRHEFDADHHRQRHRRAGDGFDFAARVDAMRCHSTAALRAMVKEARTEQQRWHLEELAALRVLDDRNALGPVKDAPSARGPRPTTSRPPARSSSCPAWRRRPTTAPSHGTRPAPWCSSRPPTPMPSGRSGAATSSPSIWSARSARPASSPVDDVAARQRGPDARDLARRRAGGFGGKYWLPDIDGALVDKVLEHMAEQMRPAKGIALGHVGAPQGRRARRVCRDYADVQPERPVHVRDRQHHPRRRRALRPRSPVSRSPRSRSWRSCRTPRFARRRVDENGLTTTVKQPRKALPADVERHIRAS